MASELSLDKAGRISTVAGEGRGVAFLAEMNPGSWGKDTGKHWVCPRSHSKCILQAPPLGTGPRCLAMKRGHHERPQTPRQLIHSGKRAWKGREC